MRRERAKGEARVYQTIANTLKSPTKPDLGRADETPSWVKELAVGRKQFGHCMTDEGMR